MRAIVTRPAAQAAVWVEALRSRGVQAQALPLIGIAPAVDGAAVSAAWTQLRGAALVMFVSANAVEQFFAARPPNIDWPLDVAAGSTGPGTTAALRAAGVVRVVEPAPESLQFDSEALWARVASWPWQGSKVMVVRGEEGRDWLAQQLTAAGAEVSFVGAYRRLAPVWDEQAQAVIGNALAEPRNCTWLFSSSEAVGHLARLAPGASWQASSALASHPRIAQAAQQAGFGRVDHVGPSIAAVADYLLRV